jgi:eukaryotic-like serine/threonine-protein kinase
MSERGTAEGAGDSAPVSGAEPTLAASPGSGGPRAEVRPRAERAEARPRAEGPGSDDTLASGAAAEGGLVSGERKKDPAKDWTGREVAGRYRILERIGEGGMGVVYVAEHLTLRKKVAFKVIHPELAAHAELMARFKREALATGQLDHPHITAAIDFDALPDGGAFLVMPWVRGHSLQAELDQNGKFELRRAAELCAHIADALSAAHAVGIIHRDLKPDNVMLEQRSDGSEAAKVLDFGVASLAGRPEGLSVDARPLTQAGTVLGTPGYMSPEQASAGEVDYRTDLYALGVILWELCRGERLFSGTDITQIFAKQFREVPPPLELGHSPAARELSQLVTRLLSWDKAARPASAGEVRDTLRRIASLNQATLLPDRARAFVVQHQKRIALGAGAAAMALALGLLLRRGDEPAATPLTDNPDLQDAIVIEPPGKPAAKVADKPAAKPAPVVQAPREEPRPTPKAPEPARNERLERELRENFETLVTSRNMDSRRLAAKNLQRVKNLPRYIDLGVRFELATRCKLKKQVLAEITELADPRLLPALERVDETPRRGCGLFSMYDCYGCMRRELDASMTTLAHAGQ